MIIVACERSDKTRTNAPGNIVKKVMVHSIAIQPFNDVDSLLVRKISTGIEKQLNVTVNPFPPKGIPYFAYYPARQRYIADSLLIYLRFVNRNKNEKIIGITSKDISTQKLPYDNWGVLGLGSCPGEACLISSYRAGKNKVKAIVFEKRMISLALHELGHTYGLEHCPVFHCVMKDAKGKMALDDGDSYCEKCRNYLQAKGILSIQTASEK